MDIELLSRMVGELVLDNDRVGLPGMGTFVAEVVPASFSDKGYTINPPYRRLSFHSGHPDDDLLARYYADSNSIPVPEAKAIIADYVSQMKEVLKSRKTVIFPGLGRLRATKDNTFFFVADQDLDIYPEGMMLAPVSLKTHAETPEEVARAVSSLSELIAAQPLAPAPVPEPEAEAAKEPAPTADQAAEADASAATLALTNRSKEASASAAPGGRKPFRWWLIPLALLILAVVAFAVFMILARVTPDFIDSILYTPEELRIINY
jgi:nucleoid DNA-binding protein